MDQKCDLPTRNVIYQPEVAGMEVQNGPGEQCTLLPQDLRACNMGSGAQTMDIYYYQYSVGGVNSVIPSLWKLLAFSGWTHSPLCYIREQQYNMISQWCKHAIQNYLTLPVNCFVCRAYIHHSVASCQLQLSGVSKHNALLMHFCSFPRLISLPQTIQNNLNTITFPPPLHPVTTAQKKQLHMKLIICMQ